MGRNRQRTTDPVDKEALALAIALFRANEPDMSYHEAAKTHGVATATLIRHEKGLVHPRATQGRFLNVFTDAQELEIVRYLKRENERFFGLTRFLLAQKAYSLAQANNLDYPPSWNTRKFAGIDWVYAFMKRHPNISVRTSSQLNQARIVGFTRKNVYRFFDNLESVLQSFPSVNANHIYNMDETGMSIIPKRKPKVIAPRGAKSVHTRCHGERAKLVTMIGCFNASGTIFVPPMFIFPGNQAPSEEDLFMGPVGSAAANSKKGWSNAGIFLKWLEHFKSYVVTTPDCPAVLVLDNHSTHINLEAVEYCLKNNIVMVTIPPHSSDRLQPLDVGFFSPLKKKYGDAMYAWVRQNQGIKPKEVEIPKILKEAYDSLCYPSLAINTFNKCGIWSPILGSPNRLIFAEADFYQSEEEEQEESNQPNDPSDLLEDPPSSSSDDDEGQVYQQPISTPPEIVASPNAPPSPNSEDLAQDEGNCPTSNNTDTNLITSLIHSDSLNTANNVNIVEQLDRPNISSTSQVQELPHSIRSILGKPSSSTSGSFHSSLCEYTLVEKNDFEEKYDELRDDFGIEVSQQELEDAYGQLDASEGIVLPKPKRRRDEQTQFTVSPSDLDPVVVPVQSSKKGRSQSSEILTSPEVVQSLENRELKKQEASFRKNAK